MVILFDLLDNIGEGDRPHSLEGGCLNFLVIGTENRLDSPADLTLGVGGWIDVQEIVVHLDGPVDF